jgi:hypothetical protein
MIFLEKMKPKLSHYDTRKQIIIAFTHARPTCDIGDKS